MWGKVKKAKREKAGKVRNHTSPLHLFTFSPLPFFTFHLFHFSVFGTRPVSQCDTAPDPLRVLRAFVVKNLWDAKKRRPQSDRLL